MSNDKVKILSWNIAGAFNFNYNLLPKIIDFISNFDGDIVTLQEVHTSKKLHETLKDELKHRGYHHTVFSGNFDHKIKKYGNLITSKYQIELSNCAWASDAPFPQLLAKAIIKIDGYVPIEIMTVHIPNGTQNGWKKIETFEFIQNYLKKIGDQPIILTGDFNEPFGFHDNGGIISFGATATGKNGRRILSNLDGVLTRKGETHPRSRWNDAVCSILESKLLIHAYCSLHGQKLICTHKTTNEKERFFDHILISTDLKSLEAGFIHDVRLGPNALSDHSAAWAVLKITKT